MSETFSASTSITIDAPAARVWQALTDPAQVKEYLFGTTMSAEWRVGGKITYQGEWQGKSYEDKGEVLAIDPGHLLQSTYLSGNTDLEDKPENYDTVTYALAEADGKTTVTVTQENTLSQESVDGSVANWQQVLQGMKALIEADALDK